jgi:cysteine dioxygenase
MYKPLIISTSSPETVYDWMSLAAEVHKDFSKMREVLKEAGVTADVLSSLCIHPRGNEPYGRHVLHSTQDFEIMLATWVVGAECAPHDHGHSDGAVWLVTGEFLESHYSFDEKFETVGTPRVWTKDSLLSVVSGEIHSMKALSGGISLHFYAPAIHDMKVFDVHNRRTLTVADDCGAWVPENSTKILDWVSWQNQ